MEFEIDGTRYVVQPLAPDLGVIKTDGQMVAGYSYGGPDRGYHVQAARFEGEVRGPRLADCCRVLLAQS